MTAPHPAASAPTRIGSLCTGYGGLDLAAHDVFGGELKWLVEYDRYAAQVCATRFVGVPNLHDLTALDWEQVPPVDVLTAGYPCQPFSHAGKRKGTKDVRHLWPYIARAVRVLRPRVVVLENVAGHIDLGLDVVLGDLAALGFDAEWGLVRASDVGACHQRARLFIVASEPDGRRRDWWRQSEPAAEGHRLEAGERRPARAGADAAHADREGVEGLGRTEAPGRLEPVRGGQGVPSDTEDWVEPCEPTRDGRDPAMVGTRARAGRGDRPGDLAEGVHELGRSAGVAWSDFEPAIRRHEQAIGRSAPRPTDELGRLSPMFVEWMQMLPAGWVTDVIDSRPQALKILGNGVVPPQAAYALRHLLEREPVAA